MIELNQLQQLIAIYENKTISNAANKLNISQPALSRSMQRLEDDLSVELFDHQTNKVVMNKNGELVVKYAKKILNDVSKMVEDVQSLDKSFTTISIGCAAPAPLWDIEPIISSLYPETTINHKIFDVELLLPALLKNEYQIIIIPEEIEHPDVLCIPYLDEDLFLSIPPTHRLHDKKEVCFNDMIGETMVLYSNIGFWHNMHIKTMPDTQFIYQDERNAFLEIVKSSTLPSFTTNLSIKREGKTDNRVIIPFSDDLAHVTFFFAILKKNKNKYKELIKSIENYYDF